MGWGFKGTEDYPIVVCKHSKKCKNIFCIHHQYSFNKYKENKMFQSGIEYTISDLYGTEECEGDSANESK